MLMTMTVFIKITIVIMYDDVNKLLSHKSGPICQETVSYWNDADNVDDDDFIDDKDNHDHNHLYHDVHT